eukprot:g2024.t1
MVPAQVVVVGGGVIGLSVAYHLAKNGCSDVVLLEQAKLTSGTTWHAAGLIGTSRGTAAETRLSMVGTELYETLEADTGLSTGFRRCGSLTVARTADRLHALRRTAAKARSFGLEAEIVGPAEAERLWNGVLTADGLEGALWLPGDGNASPTDLSMSLAAGARAGGVRIIEGARVAEFDVRESRAGGQASGRRVSGVVLEDGRRIAADTVALCAGQWSRHAAMSAGVHVPLHSAEHFYVITEPVAGVDNTLPVLRDPDVLVYMREWGGGLCVGGFERDAKPIWTHGPPSDFAFGLLPDDWEHFLPLYEGAAERVPALATAGVQTFFNGPESFTTDARYVMGEAPSLGGFFVAAGFNSSGIASAGGAGRALAEWIVAGAPTMDLDAVDIRRFGRFHANGQLLRARVGETLGLHYAMPWPGREMESARGLRRSALHARLEAQGAAFGEKFGWERARWFDRGQGRVRGQGRELEEGQELERERVAGYTFGRPAWLAHAGAEHLHTRAACSLFDVSSFAKTLVVGADAEAAMQRICANNVAVPPGQLVYTPMLNAAGGFESDVTVARLSAEEYLVVSPTAHATRDLHWIRSDLARAPRVHAAAVDVTGATSVLALMGPLSRRVLARACGIDADADTGPLSNAAFPFGTWQELDVGMAVVRAARISYVGELGWELFAPVESAHTVYDALHAAAAELERGDGDAAEAAPVLCDGGYFAIDSLRIEKGFRAYGHELDVGITPFEAGLGFAVDLKSGKDFNGRDALLRRREEGPRRRVATLLLDATADNDDGLMLWGGEPILCDGESAGIVTSAALGHTVGGFVCLAEVTHPRMVEKGFAARHAFEVDVAGRTVPAKLQWKCAHDPAGAAMRQ